MIIAGLDGCRGGWICVTRKLGSRRIDACIVATIADLAARRPDVALIDIPIGLADAGPRDCDTEARVCLGVRRSSVFPAPIRPVLHATTREEACAIGRRIDGRGIGCTTWAIFPKIREVDALMRAGPRPGWLHEVHPELSFCAWSGGIPMAHPKKTGEGRHARAKLVRSRYGAALGSAVDSLPRGGWAYDDLLDAFAALWSAERFADGRALSLGGPHDRFGLPMRILA